MLVRDGKLVDITPKDDGEKKILFQPDSTRRYERRVVNAVRRPLCPEAQGYLDMVEATNQLLLRYERIPNVRGTTPYRWEAMSPADRERAVQLASDSLGLLPRLVDLSRRKSRAHVSVQEG